jgi:hypothetical protein
MLCGGATVNGIGSAVTRVSSVAGAVLYCAVAILGNSAQATNKQIVSCFPLTLTLPDA